MTAPRTTRHHFEMGLTRADFLRLLPVAVGHVAFRADGDDITSDGGAIPWRIRVEERPGRAFGTAAVPVLAVWLVLDDASEDESRRFLDRFLLGYQRAGG